MSRYRWSFEERDAYDEGYRACFGGNPYERYGSHEEEQKHRAWDDGYNDERRERERREEERAEEERREYEDRRAREGAAYDEAMYEQQRYEEQPPCEPEPEPQEEP